jgi:hypothetical protein
MERPLRKRRGPKLAVALIAALLALNVALLLVQPGLALPRSLANYFFGPQMIRAEVVMKVGGVLHDYRIDQGRVRAIAPRAGTITLAERDGTLVTVNVAPNARIEVNGQTIKLQALRRGTKVAVVRDGEQPAELIVATL